MNPSTIMSIPTRLAKTILIAATALSANAASAKTLYMTVRRDFSPQEKPVIEVNYQKANPITFRVLKPKDMKAFIASQIDLRRAWRQPKWEFNPSHFLARSYNASDFSVDWIRRGSEIALRQSVPELGGAAYSSGTARMPLGPEKLISLPEAFTLVTEQTITPEALDKTNPFDVPGFTDEGDSWYGSNLQTKMIELPKLEAGFYLVQTLQGDSEGQVVVVVNDLMAQLQQSGTSNSSQAQIRVVSRNGRPVTGAQVSMRSLQGSWIQNGKTDQNGELRFDKLKETQLLTVVETPKGGTAIIDSEFFPTTAVFPDLYLYTDRPMYRQGDSVSFRGILRELSQGTSKSGVVKSGTKVEVKLVGANGEPTGAKMLATVTSFGTFFGEFKVRDEDNEGVYRVVANVAGAEHIGEVRVKQYVKPLFFVQITSGQETLRAGETLNAEIKAERYAGGAPIAPTATAHLYRVKKDAPQWIEDAGLGETGSAVTYGFDAAQGPRDLPVLVAEKSDIKLDGKGLAAVKMEVPKELPGDSGYNYTFQLRVSVTDADGNTAASSKSFFDLVSEVVAQTRFSEFLAVSGSKPTLSIRSTTPGGQPFAKAKGSVEFFVTPYGGKPRSVKKQSIETDDKGLARIEAPVGGNGELRALVTLQDQKKRPATAEASMILAGEPPEKGVVRVEELRLMTADATVSAGETIRLLALMPEGWGVDRTNAGNLYVTVAGRTIHSTRMIPLDGLGAWIEQKIDPSFGSAVSLVVSYGDPQNGWTERRSSFRILDPSKGLKVTVQPAVDMAVPGGSQTVRVKVLGYDGKPRAKTELSIAVVDRAVLDMQPELRPGLLDFFYPTDRLNLMTFVSSQFQSYGYAEKIARLFKPNYWFGATKSEAEPLDQKDTAYWKADVVTDEKGEAKVDFVLPGNQTIWKVIAVAADTEGKFGEGSAEFKANLPVNMLLGFPQFMRRGDEAELRVSLNSNEASKSHEVKYTMLPSNVVKLKEPLTISGPVKPNGSLAKTTTITVSTEVEPQTTSLLSQIEISGSKLSFKNPLKVQTDLTDQIEGIEPDSKTGEILLSMQPGEKLRAATLRVSNGLYASVFPSMRWLIRYPYGCVEQLTSSTIPNLVFASVLEEAKKNKLVLSKEESDLLSSARDFAKSGLNRLKSYRKEDGSFAWFASEGTGDVNMTLLVLSVITNVDDLNLVSPLYEWTNSLEWLRKQGIPQATSQGITLSFIESAFHVTWSSRVNESETIAKLKLQSEKTLATGSVTDKALLARAIKRFNFKDTQLDGSYAKLIASLQNTLNGLSRTTALRPADWVPAENWPGYPGRMGSSIALAARAVYESQKNQADYAQHEKWRNRVMDHFDGVSFGSTFETSMTLLNTGYLIRHELKTRASQAVNVANAITLNGKALATTGMKRRSTLGGVDIDLVPASLAGGGKIGIGNLGGNAVVRLIARKGLALGSTKPVNGGWSLTRQYFKIAANGAKTPFDPTKDRVKVGDLLFVQIDFDRKSQPSIWASRYYILSEQIPAGFSVVDEDKPYEAAPFNLPIRGANFRVREIGAEQTRWYFDFTRGWMEKPGSVGLVLRANYGGRFASGVTKIMDFYEEERYSQTPSAVIAVDPIGAAN